MIVSAEMEDCSIRYREVIPNQSVEEKWKEITLTFGGTQSTLQDIIAEKAGGFCYADKSNLQSRNRYIYWRTSHDILELSEVSLDLDLVDNNVRYKFSESRILAVSVCELVDFIVILVATVGSVHRLYYPHPNQLHKSTVLDTKCMSIFKEASVTHARDPLTFHMIGSATSTNQPIAHAAACGMNEDGSEAYFALARQNTLTLFTMNCSNGHTVSMELRQTNMFYVGKTSSNNNYVNSLIFYTIADVTYLFALYRDNFLRMWSLGSGQCVATINCHEDSTETKLQNPQNSTLRCGKSNTICAFLSYASGCEFVIINVAPDPIGGSNHTLNLVNIILAPSYDLIEYQLTENRIWGFSVNSEGEYKVSSVSLVPGSGVNWISAALQPLPDRFTAQQIEITKDPRQAYCSYIFQPGRFQKSVIAKALVMFRRSNILPDNNYPISILKDRVCHAVATDIENEIRGLDLPDEEYIEICVYFWDKFYSCCEQYHMKACQPIGLIPLQLESLDTVCIVKKNMFSLLRRCELLEHCMLSGRQVDTEEGSQLPRELEENSAKMDGLVKLVAILAEIEHQIPDDDKLDIDRRLYQLQMPINIVYNLVREMLAGEYDKTPLTRAFLTQIRQQALNIKDVPEAMHALLEALRLDFAPQDEMSRYSGQNEHIKNLFASQFGISIVAESLEQIATIRYVLCRNLLILQHIFIDTNALPSDVLENVRSHQMPETEVFVQAYFVIVWICKSSADPGYVNSSLDSSINRLNSLQLSDARQFMLKTTEPCSLLELFLKNRGWHMMLQHYMSGNFRTPINESQTETTLLSLATIVGQLVWPVSGNFAFGAWLIGSCQQIHIQDYVRLLNGWCEWNNCSRQFILAVSMLDSGEVEKAYDLFIQASRGVYTEPFLMEKIIGQDMEGELTTGEAIVMYYLKVIRLFEQYNALQCVIRLAQSAIQLLVPKHPQLAMFQSIMFTNHLALNHYEEAYHSLISNVEPSRRKDYLRELVMCLFQKKRLDLLMRFPYIGLQDELESIIETRARSMPIEDNIHYNFLYAFFITKDNMRKAAAVMYEQAMRFGYESNSLDAMQYRYDCLLACVNALHLVDKQYAWIAKPVSSKEDGYLVDKVVVLEIEDIRRELHYIEASIILSRHRRELSSVLKVGADELVALLSTSRLFTAAIKLARTYKITPTVVVENLASACVHASSEQSNEVWQWLQENDLADLPLKNSPVAVAWNLLEKLVTENEVTGTTIIRRCVAKRILHLGTFLPYWLFLSYKKANPSELLHLFIVHGHLVEATDFATSYLAAMLGNNYEAFGLRNSLLPNEAALCLPVHDLDLLLHALKLNFDYDTAYEEAHKKLTDCVDEYLTAVDEVSVSKVQYELQKC
uniref:Putative nuclear pore complex nup160 component n=1 Tax=Lutzomyia longipalpis TaxID=7200 RepID=A0A1B0CGF9_LUTLO